MGNMITIALMLDERRKYNEKRKKMEKKIYLGAPLLEPPLVNSTKFLPQVALSPEPS